MKSEIETHLKTQDKLSKMNNFYQKQKNKKYRNCGSQIGISQIIKESSTKFSNIEIPEANLHIECSTALLNQHKRGLSSNMPSGEPFKEVGNMFF